MDSGNDRLMHHEYDGIQEFDNPTPGWWHLIFVGTVFFSIMYYAFWHFSPAAWTNESALRDRQVAEFKKLFGSLGELKNDQATLHMLMKRDDMMAVAQGTFQTTCASCHSKDGGGLPAGGVNLTDNHYKNVKVMEDIFNVITNGANSGAMPSQKNTLTENERILLAAYVAHLRGTTPASPKPPEGEVIPPWPAGAP